MRVAWWAFLTLSLVVNGNSSHGQTPPRPGGNDPGAPADDADAEEGEKLEPGLVASYREVGRAGGGATLSRVEPKPSFAMGHSSPHPRIPPGPFETTWDGTLDQTSKDSFRFGAYLGGTLTVTLGGVSVLEARGESETTWVEATSPREWPRGPHPLRVVYRSLPGVPARLQLWWEGSSFSWEPLPAWRFKHPAAAAPDALRRDEVSARGRVAAGRFGCARCHSSALPAVDDPAPGPSLAGLGRRVTRSWMLGWLDDPSGVREGAKMPALFSPGRAGFVERWAVSDYLLKVSGSDGARPGSSPGDARAGRTAFLSLGCIACHPRPDEPRPVVVTGESGLTGLRDRMPTGELAAFLHDPHSRYPDGRMPRLPVTAEKARDIAAYLLSFGPNASPEVPIAAPATPEELDVVARRLGVSGLEAAGRALVREKRCAQCHEGLGEGPPGDVPIRAAVWEREGSGCLAPRSRPGFTLASETRKAIAAYLAVAAGERYPSPFEQRRQLLTRVGCLRCHQRDAEHLAPLEEAGSRVVEHDLVNLPGQRTPKLTNVLSKYHLTYVRSAVRDGASGARGASYTYRMPAYGAESEPIVRALAEGDGDLLTGPEPPSPRVANPELPAQGPNLIGSAGYSCVACHLWKGRTFTAPEPGAAGPELTTVTDRIRRDYFDRWVDEPSRVHPRTPMPQIFRKGQPAPLASVLGGDSRQQKDALWAYLALGPRAPDPVSLPPAPITPPAAGGPPLVAQIPLHLPDRTVVESLCVLFGGGDVLVYDVGRCSPRDLYTGAQLLRVPENRRRFALEGSRVGPGLDAEHALRLVLLGRTEEPTSVVLLGHDRLPDGLRVRTRVKFTSGTVEMADSYRLAPDGSRRLLREVRVDGARSVAALELTTRTPDPGGGFLVTRFEGDADTRSATGLIRYDLPPAREPGHGAGPLPLAANAIAPGSIDGQVERPGYRAIAYPRPKTALGEDLVMPGAIVASPRDGRVYLASMKMGEIFALDDPQDDGRGARFVDYCGGLFQDAYAMTHDGDSLYVLHRRNLTRVRDTDGDGRADAFDRVAALQHPVTENVDNAYGLVREPSGAFVFTYAANTRQRLPGWGSVLKLTPGEAPALEELAFGLRRAYGWSLGPDDEVFFTDNQGEWVATNRLCHVDRGRYFGYPNPGQEHHLAKPAGKTAVWIPYAWALSTNGLAFDATRGKFGPFAGQFFTAGWTDRGGIIRVQVEKINGLYQGACFPFWGKGMLGPLSLAFDPRGRLFVGGITEGSCGAHPDRGGLFRIDFDGRTPFEIQSIHARPRGFRLVFTTPVDPRTARDPSSYALESYRYAYSAEYGSPELDRTPLPVTRVVPGNDGRTVDLEAGPLVKDRVYMIHARGVRSASGERPVNPTGAYTLNEIPGEP